MALAYWDQIIVVTKQEKVVIRIYLVAMKKAVQ
jgi:hypothetical protein